MLSGGGRTCPCVRKRSCRRDAEADRGLRCADAGDGATGGAVRTNASSAIPARRQMKIAFDGRTLGVMRPRVRTNHEEPLDRGWSTVTKLQHPYTNHKALGFRREVTSSWMSGPRRPSSPKMEDHPTTTPGLCTGGVYVRESGAGSQRTHSLKPLCHASALAPRLHTLSYQRFLAASHAAGGSRCSF